MHFNLFVAFAFLFTTGCIEPTVSQTSSSPAQKVASFDPKAASAEAKKFVDTLYGTKSPNGPVCLPEANQGYTQCSFTYTELDGTLKAGTILCDNTGCRTGELPVAIPVEDRPVANTSGGIDNDWLFWYLMFNNGGTSYHYHSWYTNTPVYGRSAYYTVGYTPTVESRSYYNTTYKTSVATSTAKKYPTTTTTKTTSSSGKSTTTTTTTTTKSTKSTGYSTPTRTSGYRSSSSSRSRR